MNRLAFTLARIVSYGVALALALVALTLGASGFFVGMFVSRSPIGIVLGLFCMIPAGLPAWGAWHFFDTARTAKLEAS